MTISVRMNAFSTRKRKKKIKQKQSQWKFRSVLSFRLAFPRHHNPRRRKIRCLFFFFLDGATRDSDGNEMNMMSYIAPA